MTTAQTIEALFVSIAFGAQLFSLAATACYSRRAVAARRARRLAALERR